MKYKYYEVAKEIRGSRLIKVYEYHERYSPNGEDCHYKCPDCGKIFANHLEPWYYNFCPSCGVNLKGENK